MDVVNILALCGSLRKDSYNRALFKASKKLAPEGMELELAEIGHLPLYNTDLESDFPAAANELKERVRAADGILIITPEYNFSFSGVLKNAIDWASRPYGDGAWDGKPVIVQSASIGWTGGIRAQYHLFQVLGYFQMKHLRFPEVMVGFAKDKFDANLELIDKLATENVVKQLAAFRDMIVSSRTG